MVGVVRDVRFAVQIGNKSPTVSAGFIKVASSGTIQECTRACKQSAF